MKLKLYIGAIALITIGSSCSKEKVATFTDYDKNWLVVNDNPNDPATHATFLFYKETGIPVYFNDTIGSQQRVDRFGKEYTYYEVLSLVYALGGLQSGAPPIVQAFSYCNKNDVAPALEFLKTDILSVLPDTIHVPSILLLENLNSNAFGTYAFKGFNTVAIGQVSKIPTMDAVTRAKYKGAILRAMLTNAVLNDKYKLILEKFYTASRKFVPSRDAYNLYIYQLASSVTGLPPGTTATLQAIGFLGPDPRNQYYSPISTWMDVCMYLEAALGNTEQQFTQQYGTYPNIMIKYGLIKQILTDIGIPIK